MKLLKYLVELPQFGNNLFKTLGLFSILWVLHACSTDDINPAVNINANNPTLSPDFDEILITANLNAVSTDNVTVQLNFGGSAEEGVHFTSSSQVITIPAGETSGTATINYVFGNFSEESENLIITVSNSENAISLNNQVVSITIVGEESGVNYIAENFDYPAANFLTSHNWFAHSGGTTNPIAVISPGLSFSGYVGNNIGNSAAITNDGQDVNRPFLTSFSTGTIYTSFMVKVDAPFAAAGQGEFLHLGYYENLIPNAQNSNLVATQRRCKAFLRLGTNTNTQFKLGLSFNANDPTAETDNLLIGTTYLVVLKYQFIEGATNDEVSMYVFAAGDNLSSEPATPTLGPFIRTGTISDPDALQAVALRQYNVNQNVIVDGIYVRDRWNLVNPW